MRVKRIPLRKCIACQEMMPKRELIRIVRTPKDEILIDLTGKKAGRGAYLCGKVKCFKLSKRTRAFDKALKHIVSMDIYDQLERDFIRIEDQFNASKDLADDDE